MQHKNGLIPTFFCVPDITGFTKFVATADVQFTREVIPALLRKLIEANNLKMQVAEIEGDAIFFYKTGRLPSINQVAEQCKTLYNAFSSFIENLEKNDPENYNKYLADDQLGLKIIIHYGHISLANIKGRTKLLGEDVIVVHKLLKNNVTEDNYILLTEKYLSKIQNKKSLSEWFHWEELVAGVETYEHIGDVKFCYISLEKIESMNEIISKLKPHRKKTT